ncbi:MAG: molybdate ABC transporter substrate-binding protein [Clostridiales bacterium]|nr:MAG: molybdate ABC transporter substrate-binding protein [Clostridiales bacterium]
MKKIIITSLLFLLFVFSLFGCTANNKKNDKVELVVFAAASMTETMNEIAENYMEEHKGIRIVFNFDSSGTLKTQIQEGAECDAFLSAGQKQMNALDVNHNDKGNDYLASNTRFNLLENKIALVVPENNPKQIISFDQLANSIKGQDIFLSIGSGDVPVGDYALQVLSYYGLDDKKLAKNGKITYGSNAKEITTQISESVVDAGIIYTTDAMSADLEIVDIATDDMCSRAIYPVALIKNSKKSEEGKDFLDYLKSEDAKKIFESVGFTVIK